LKSPLHTAVNVEAAGLNTSRIAIIIKKMCFYLRKKMKGTASPCAGTFEGDE
jgi:hypothetical protein